MKMFLIISSVLVTGIVISWLLSGDRERIKTLFRLYKSGKSKFPEISEREILEIVVEELIPHGKAVKLRNTGMTGKQYIDGVFEAKQLDIDELIYHIITSEFYVKYKSFTGISLEDIRKQNRNMELSARDKLKLAIKKYHQKYLG
ncbi:MAG: hypothetical protein PHS46_05585 [Candidatus Omnitrophica bacterium]|nr:hypothetical protein [Candidatus Omnitrophota bacterium]